MKGTKPLIQRRQMRLNFSNRHKLWSQTLTSNLSQWIYLFLISQKFRLLVRVCVSVCVSLTAFINSSVLFRSVPFGLWITNKDAFLSYECFIRIYIFYQSVFFPGADLIPGPSVLICTCTFPWKITVTVQFNLFKQEQTANVEDLTEKKKEFNVSFIFQF